MNIRIYNYNNYYNRIVKKMTVDSPEYDKFIYEILGANFNPSDGVTAEHIFGNNVSVYDGSGDYLLCINENNQIESRWFIVENMRLRGGQWKASLKRDTVADYYDMIFNAPAFVEKGYISDSTNPLIYNSEDMSFNQIKTPFDKAHNINEYLIKDKTDSAWIVGYYSRELANGNYTSMNGEIINENVPFIQAGNKEDWPYYTISNLDGNNNKKAASPLSSLRYNNFINPQICLQVDVDTEFNSIGYKGVTVGYTINPGQTLHSSNSPDYFAGLFSSAITEDKQMLRIQTYKEINNYIDLLSVDEYNDLLSLNGKNIKFTNDDSYYSITVNIENNNLGQVSRYLDSSVGLESNTLFAYLYNATKSEAFLFNYLSGTPNSSSYELRYGFNSWITLTLKPIALESIVYEISATREHLYDAPYDLFCIPFSDDLTIKIDSATSIKSSKKMAFEVAMDIALNRNLNDGNDDRYILYDLQLLPFSPVEYLFSEKGVIDIRELNNLSYDLIKLKSSQTPVGIIFHSYKSSLNTSVFLDNPIIIKDYKIEAMCDKYRFCSPNFNSAFEFNAAKNRGLNQINIYCNFYPYSPYIQVSPNFNNGTLYGQNYNDSRGLICSGDFSLPILNNSWTNYQLNNKNYLNTFNRQIENMEINNAVQREKQIWQAVSGSVSGIASGAMAGGMMGGPGGAIAGAVVGGAASIAGGIRDVQLGDTLRNEAIDYTKDQFGYQLGNIQAQPTTISKVSSYTVNNRIFPFIEYYTCTDTEKEALRNKIKYNGMTVMVVDKLKNYINYNTPGESYIKGKIIRLKNIIDDFHIANDIAGEINKGVFV